MATEIDKKTLEYLEKLSRVEINENLPAGQTGKISSEKLLRDLTNILNYFEELKTLDTKNVEPLSHGLQLSTVLREDIDNEKPISKQESLVSEFSKREGDFLKIPPVFKKEK